MGTLDDRCSAQAEAVQRLTILESLKRRREWTIKELAELDNVIKQIENNPQIAEHYELVRKFH